MKKIKLAITLVFLCTLFSSFAQTMPSAKKIKITGKVVDKMSKQPLGYATISFQNANDSKVITGGISNEKGDFEIDINAGVYDIKIEFISFKSTEIKSKKLIENTNLGQIILNEDAAQLNEVVIRNEKTTIEIKLDKKVYNVGTDLMVKGGTVSDILDNIPSVSIDVEGNVSLRGNENVKVLIDGKPSNAINISDALRLIPADAIDKVEVITNPSARYDAEGGGGILNIVLKKGKNKGVNGSLLATTGDPVNHGLNATLNFKTTHFNLFTTQGYSYKNNPGNAYVATTTFNNDYSVDNYLIENRNSDKISKGYNGNIGAEWFLTKSLTWTNIVNYRKNNGNNQENVFDDYFDDKHIYLSSTKRINNEVVKSENIEYTSNFTKTFEKPGHKITFDGNFSSNKDFNDALILETSNLASSIPTTDLTKNNQTQDRSLIQTDYVLPLGKNSQFEAGYRGNFLNLTTDFEVINNGVINPGFTNILAYKEKVNAVYSQFGTKFKQLSMLYGIRFEDSNIDINQLTSRIYKNKKYQNFFPSVFFTYELAPNKSLSLSYSKRINRPRGREINPFNNYSSNINIYRGNPDLNPSVTDAFEFGFLKKWTDITLSTSLYYNDTKNASQIVRLVNGYFGNVPILIATPINIASEYRTGFEFTFNYSPIKWWKLNSNFNFFRNEVKGDYTYSYTDQNTNQVINVYSDLGIVALSWFTKFSSKISFPNKLDWQTNFTYNAPQNNAQGTILGIAAVNLSFSKDVLKDNGTIGLNVNDLFNSRRRKMQTYIPGSIDSYVDLQYKVRQITFSFTYRFNKQKAEKEKLPKNQGENDDFQG